MDIFLLALNRAALPLLALLLAAMCLLWLGRHKGQHPPEAWLRNSVNGDLLRLPYFENAIGRHPRCDMVLDYGTVSRHHAVIARRGSAWVVIDTGSRVGTKRNGAEVSGSQTLANGDIVTFGAFECIFCDPAEALAQTELEAELFRSQTRTIKEEGEGWA
ncbi:MAG: FHA domain-containing protein [Oscillospiraceae bacterium]|jgi:hypothetical protein|nr:FHA domain-containing protein [Oscillospiraceae bacterium]